MPKPNILVIGSEGQLGSAICKKLNGSHNVYRADVLFSTQNPSNIELNINDEQSVRRLFKNHHFDATINCAYPRNKNYGNKLEEVTHASFVENISLNLGGYFNVMKYTGLATKDDPRPQVLLSLASIYGSIAPRFSIYDELAMTMPVEYSAIKSGLIHMNRYFAKYFQNSPIRYNTISPGGVVLSQPQKFQDSYNKHCGSIGLLQPAHVANVCEFLISDGATAINGQDIIIDDGFTL